ncbi:oxidoreductase [Flagellimonas taeanensis]|uniref:bi-domain-containing oxidoreductase n=1 Tax=Flavobacteriaceae TaxID=49546 RepID=UPI000E67AF1E|nr:MULTISPECIES: bi-domain-containing oxidoreductase [Allomuricauda]MDC6385470.1 bi-domain-containing oxidoreductase [Muricauda sp. SK9]RIV53022.1 oxidoreductase [Allomuricauda taeanensis]
MKQVIQNFKTGDLYIDEVPVPAITDRMVLVENKFSLISSGTERGTVKVAKANLIGKAKQRPDLVAQVLQNMKKEGIKATLDKVRTKLDSLKALGYSTSGVIKASLDSNSIFKPGDRVACAGQDYASHSEFVGVPQNLVAKIPDNVSFEEASYTTLGAIALQGVRQAEPRLGDKVCVIGLGLLGQITVQLLKANGCRVFGVDLSPKLVEISKGSGADEALLRGDENLLTATDNFTNGHGFDSVIITAATSSNDPIELSAIISRKKGKVIVVGAVKMDIPRDPDFYRKELELKMSCSYGPGRYDVNYEENGNDYPLAYVRYTEQRNMEAFLDLVSQGVIRLNDLTTHVFDISEAEKAYEIVMGTNPEPHIGILLSYPDSSEGKDSTSVPLSRNKPLGALNVGFIGAGSFAQSYLIPHVKSWGEASLDTVVTTKGISAKNVASKFLFNNASTSSADVLNNDGINTVFIATPHNSHAKYVVECLEAGKNVFVEKPLAMNTEELIKVKSAYETNQGLLMVGFNRRFSPLASRIKAEFENNGEPKVINIRINAGFIPKEHWTQNPELGGGRVIGEMCHFIDLFQFFVDAKPVKVYAECIKTNNTQITPEDNISVVVSFGDGSIGNLLYLGNGDKSMPKELVEVFSGGKIGRIFDFRNGSIHKNNKEIKLKESGKGHRQEVMAFLASLKDNGKEPIPFESIYNTTLVTFKILDSLVTGLPQTIN